MLRRILMVVLACGMAWPSTLRASEQGAVGRNDVRDPRAVVAYEAGLESLAAGELDASIVHFDLASDLDSTWSAPVRARSEAFGRLAERHRPCSVFLAARADDLERLLVLEPGIDTTARSNEIAQLRRESRNATHKEERRRKLAKPAAVTITLSAGLLLAGALLFTIKPREALASSTYRQERRDRAATALLVAGGALAPAAITLGVLGFGQARRDSVVRDHRMQTDRPGVEVVLAPQVTRGGGGMGLAMRF